MVLQAPPVFEPARRQGGAVGRGMAARRQCVGPFVWKEYKKARRMEWPAVRARNVGVRARLVVAMPR